MKLIAIVVAARALSVRAALCPWASTCINSEGACQQCNASPFAGDDRCVCGPAAKDWINKGECKACGPTPPAPSPPSPAGCGKCINSEGACQQCNPSPFAGDDRCVCGPGVKDWIPPSQ